MILWVLHIGIIGVLSWLAFRYFKKTFTSAIFWSALSLKLAAGWILGAIYIFYFGEGDTIALFNMAKDMASLSLNDHIDQLFQWSSYQETNQPRVLYFTKLLSVLARVTGNSYWITSLYLSLISFFSTAFLAKVLIGQYENHRSWITICLFYIPSVVFWSSGILKDSVSFSAFIYLISICLIIRKRGKISIIPILLSFIALFVLFKIKHYLFILLLLFVALIYFFKWISHRKSIVKWVAVTMLLASVFVTQFIHPYLTLERLPLTIYENNQTIISKTNPNAQIDMLLETPEWKSVIKLVPKAIHTGLFRPSFFDKTSNWGLIHKLENGILTFLMLFTILVYLKSKPSLEYSLLLPALICIILLVTLLALSTPNFGTLVRYKNIATPFLFLLFGALPFKFFTSGSIE